MSEYATAASSITISMPPSGWSTSGCPPLPSSGRGTRAGPENMGASLLNEANTGTLVCPTAVTPELRKVPIGRGTDEADATTRSDIIGAMERMDIEEPNGRPDDTLCFLSPKIPLL